MNDDEVVARARQLLTAALHKGEEAVALVRTCDPPDPELIAQVEREVEETRAELLALDQPRPILETMADYQLAIDASVLTIDPDSATRADVEKLATELLTQYDFAPALVEELQARAQRAGR